MSDQFVGIEEARGRLGDLVTVAQQGIDTVLTRNRRPVARITRVQEDLMPATALIAPLSDGTLAAIGGVVKCMIEKEYGTSDRDAMIGARILALSGVQMDIARAFLARNDGDDRGLVGYAETVLRQLVTEGLAVRRCQCPLISSAGHIGRCEGHYEFDVPAVNERVLCGTCYAAEHAG